MPYWGWLAVGVALLVLEVMAGTEFWLALIGSAALGVGFISFLGLAGPTWVQWAIFGTLSVVMLVFVRRKLSETLVGNAPGIKPELIGETATAEAEIGPGESGSVQVRGSVWRARNVGPGKILAGGTASIDAVDGLILSVRAD